MLEELAKQMIRQLIKAHMPKDQKIIVCFQPPEGELVIKHIRGKHNDTYKVGFKDIEEIVNGKTGGDKK